MLLRPLEAAGAIAPFPAADPSQRDSCWETCRNSLAIARLLAHERRSEAYVATASAIAVESACRAALAQTGLGYDGDVRKALERLAVPPEMLVAEPEVAGLARVAAAERVVGWLSEFLRSAAPERAWSY